MLFYVFCQTFHFHIGTPPVFKFGKGVNYVQRLRGKKFHMIFAVSGSRC